ncbi:MAG: alpha-1,4-glucan:maltose-1-phosphate maltosyltransferase [Gemmatales bacterium]|nr:MAG: alpha-1,4-glucan:maltose-1-phosphate maltosyltransferase [Gemmatales bacterium]
MEVKDGQVRVVIERVTPQIDCGRFPVKRSVDELVVVEADIFADGHDALAAVLRYRHGSAAEWTEIPMEFVVNDRWRAVFAVPQLGDYFYTIQAWVDRFESWRQDLRKRVDAGQEVDVPLAVGAKLIVETANKTRGTEAKELHEAANKLVATTTPPTERIAAALDENLSQMMRKLSPRLHAAQFERELRVVVEPVKARFSTWYEMFPRSCAGEPGKHGTFRDCENRLPYIAEMGFDVLYFPPIHPIGRSFRKGKNNSLTCTPDDVGSPWGIGSEEGGHKAIHPQLGTLADFQHLVAKAKEFGIDIALDIAFQCSPDHPYVKEHPQWFRHRPDGTIQYAENPPKKYQDIYPLDFETEDWRSLWDELKSVFLFWIEQGIRIFRVDNPHTKPFRFWEWVIAEIKRQYPDVIFLSEAFTRPKVMYRLAKLGYSQSYTYFAWRNTKRELTEYFTELTQTEVREFFRPNLWPNTPDILNEYLQHGGRPAFMIRLVLAATLGASYGIYGPAYELCINTPFAPGSEEYLDSEKYEIKSWDLHAPHSLKDFIARVNRIRKDNRALQHNFSLQFHPVSNDELICYSKRDTGQRHSGRRESESILHAFRMGRFASGATRSRSSAAFSGS